MRTLMTAVVFLVCGCSPLAPGQLAGRTAEHQAPAGNRDATLPLLVSARDLMGGEIAFSAHIVDDLRGSGRPHQYSEWGAVRTAAANLSASATLLTMSNPSLIDALRRQDPQWRRLAQSMQEASTQMAAAAFLRDDNALSGSVIALRQSCQACHARFGVHGE
jgi:hypothetical protein